MSGLLAAAALLAAAPAQAGPGPAAASARTAPAPPVDPARLAAATRLVDAMHLDATLDRLNMQLGPAFAQGLIGAMTNDADGRGLIDAIRRKPNGNDRLIAILSQEFLTEMRRQYPALKRGTAEEYAAAFTTEELAAITAFYSSGPGAKALAMQGELQQRLGERGRELGRTAGAAAARRALQRAAHDILEINDRPAA